MALSRCHVRHVGRIYIATDNINRVVHTPERPWHDRVYYRAIPDRFVIFDSQKKFGDTNITEYNSCPYLSTIRTAS